MKTQFECQIVPHRIGFLKPKRGETYYVNSGDNWVRAFLKDGAWRYADADVAGRSIEPQPTLFLTPTDESPPPGEAEPRTGWNCGNRGLAARYLMLLIERHPAMTVQQMEWILDTIDQGGAQFCKSRLEFFTSDEVPF